MSMYLYLCDRSDEDACQANDGYKTEILFYFGQDALDFVMKHGSITHSTWKLTILQVTDKEDESELRNFHLPKLYEYGLDVNSIVWQPSTSSRFGIKHQNNWYLINLNLKDEDGIYARNIIAEKVDFMGEF